MGYTVYVVKCEFSMQAENRKPALAALRAADPGWWFKAEPKRLEDFLEQKDWDVESDEDDNIIGLEYARENARDVEDEVFAAIGPFVGAGSLIEFRGEDGERWRYVFDGQKMTVKRARQTWD